MQGTGCSGSRPLASFLDGYGEYQEQYSKEDVHGAQVKEENVVGSSYLERRLKWIKVYGGPCKMEVYLASTRNVQDNFGWRFTRVVFIMAQSISFVDGEKKKKIEILQKQEYYRHTKS